jgi:uncharacterized protein (TIGR03437 family)
MRGLTFLLISVAVGGCLMGQSLVGYGYTLPTPVYAAPGQLVTLIVQITDRSGVEPTNAPASANLPTTLSGFSVGYFQGNPDPVPILSVLPFYALPVPWDFRQGSPVCFPSCAALVALTVQIPFEAQSCPTLLCAGLNIAPGQLNIQQNGASGTAISVQPFADQVHIVTSCDSFTSGYGAEFTWTGLPCPSAVTHGDGSPVTATNPAKAGEELVAYAVGLGQTSPPLVTGKLVTAAAPTQTTFGLDFNYRPNAMPTKPLASALAPVYAGATPGYVGLYQVNFVVPPVPAGTPPCVDASGLHPAPGQKLVLSNLTVSVGGLFSFDGARICVAVPSP